MVANDFPKTYRTNVLIIGESCVGKSAICEVVTADVSYYPRNYNFTMGFQLKSKSYQIPETNDTVELHLVDSSGNSLYQDILQQSWPKNSLVCLVYDMTNRPTFDKIPAWENKMQNFSVKGMPGLLLANKCDLTNRRFVMESSGKEFAQNNRLKYFETSAKENINLHEAFRSLAIEWYKLVRK